MAHKKKPMQKPKAKMPEKKEMDKAKMKSKGDCKYQ